MGFVCVPAPPRPPQCIPPAYRDIIHHVNAHTFDWATSTERSVYVHIHAGHESSSLMTEAAGFKVYSEV